MLKDISQKFTSGTVMLLRKQKGKVVFLGSACLIHQDGYLVTAAHLFGDDEQDLMISKALEVDAFTPLYTPNVHAHRVSVCAVDRIHNVAILRLEIEHVISAPDHLIGLPDTLPVGSSLMSVGIPFGHRKMHNIAVRHAVLSAFAVTRYGSRIIIFDAITGEGSSGGPLVSLHTGRCVGIIIGRFNPSDEGSYLEYGTPDGCGQETGLSYAVSSEYVIDLLSSLSVELS